MLKFTSRDYLLSIQHLFAMFGATVLVPLMTGMNPATALFTAGVGTLLFHCCTKFKVPVFLGSSFAFLPAMIAIIRDGDAVRVDQIPYVQGGVLFAGVVYVGIAAIAFIAGADKIKKLFPPVVTGPIIIVIGIGLSSVAIKDAMGNPANASAGLTWETGLNLLIALFTLLVVVAFTMFAKGFFKLIPILFGIASGYVLCLILNLFGVFHMDFTPIQQADWINIPFVSKDIHGVPFFTLPKFDLGVILSIAPIAFVTVVEHIGDITTNGAVVGKDFLKDPGLHRTLMGDGLATFFAGAVGGPPNTTYSENTGVLASTKNYNPRLLRLAAVFAILLALFGKFGAVLQTIPDPVKGGVEMILFGMIAAIGARTLADAKLDFTHSRNLLIVGLILVTGLGIGGIGGFTIAVGEFSLTITGLFVAVVIGVAANLILPAAEDTVKAK